MNDLEVLLIADEDARARLEAVRADQAARRDQARSECERKRQAATEALTASLERELADIVAQADADASRRDAARREWIASVEARAAGLVEPAAALWVRIVEEGQVP